MLEERKEKRTGFWESLQDFLYGMAYHRHVKAALRMKMQQEHVFMFMTLGDMLGIPVLPPYYSLRLFPFAIPNIKSWKRRILREKDFI